MSGSGYVIIRSKWKNMITSTAHHSNSFLCALALPAGETLRQLNLNDLMVPQNMVRNLWANRLALLDGNLLPHVFRSPTVLTIMCVDIIFYTRVRKPHFLA